MSYLKKTIKSIAYVFLFLLVSLCIYTFITIDVIGKDYVNVFGYTYFVVKTGSMSGTLEVNDVIIVKVTKKAKIGDVITYINDNKEIITHRYIRKDGNKIIAQGDVNNAEDDPITEDNLIGVVSNSFSPILILKFIIVFIILFIFLALINFDTIIKKFVIKDKKYVINGDDLEEISDSSVEVLDDSSGYTINIPIEEIEKVGLMEEKIEEVETLEEIEVLDIDDIIDVSNDDVIKNISKEEKELLEQISNLLKMKNNSLKNSKINKEWLEKYQYIYKLAQIIYQGDTIELNEVITHPTFKEIYDYDLEKTGLYENLRNKIYDMPIYVFLKILVFAILYNDLEFFDGVYKILKYKIQVDKNNDFKELNKDDSYGRNELKLFITFMEKISKEFDNKHVFELERIEKYVKLKNYVNN